jgi:peptide/nickel transport system substrate-binding protein
MSVVSYFHQQFRFGGKGKIILYGLTVCIISFSLIYTTLGISGCKNVDKVSDSLIFRYNEDATVSTLDPAYVRSQSEIWIVQQLFNSLIELDSALSPKPGLAESWEISGDKLVYKFRLRPDVFFFFPSGDKKKLTARDVVYSFNRILSPSTASPSAWVFAGKVLECNACPPPFEALSDSVFILRLNRPDPTMLAVLGTVFCSIIPEGDGKLNGDFGRNPIGTGPFYMKMWEEDVKMVLRRNPVYFEKWNGQSLPFLEAVNVDFIKNKQTAFMRFVAGEYDFFNGIEGSFKDELLTHEGQLQPKYNEQFNLMRKPFLNTEYIGFWLEDTLEGKKNLYANRHIRRALSLAIDRKAMIKYLRNGIGDVGNSGFTPPVLLGRKITGLGFDKKRAAEELEKAGYPAGKGLPELNLTTTADYLDMAVFIKKCWAEIGVIANVEVQTGGMLRQLRNQGKLGMFRGSWIADVPDAENYLACMSSDNHSPNGPNYTHYKNPEFDAMFRKSFQTSGIERQNFLTAADSIALADAPVIILYYDQSIRLYQTNVFGLTNDPANRLTLKTVRKTPFINAAR